MSFPKIRPRKEKLLAVNETLKYTVCSSEGLLVTVSTAKQKIVHLLGRVVPSIFRVCLKNSFGGDASQNEFMFWITSGVYAL